MSVSKEKNSIDEIIKAGEGPTVEFKKSDIFSNPLHLAEAMVALANTQGGRILVGVLDDGTFEGMKEKKGHELYVMDIARDKCNPPLIPRFLTHNKTNGVIYEIIISRYRSIPNNIKTKEGGVYYIRVGTTDREATPLELATLYEANREEITKKPDLKLSLKDNTGNAVKEIIVSPLYTIIKEVKESPSSPISKYFEELGNLPYLDTFQTKEPSPDLVPVQIELTNSGQAPAKGIMIFMEFPEVCELKDKNEVIGGYVLAQPKKDHGGLYINTENKGEAIAWLDSLGNDRSMDDFNEIYVKFPAETKEHKLKARVIQDNYPPTDFEFMVKITPQFREIT